MRGQEDNRFIDLEKLEKEISRLKKENVNLIRQQNEESAKLSKIVKEQLTISKQRDDFIAETKLLADNIIAKAKTVESKANEKNSLAEIKLAELNVLQKQVKDLISSNEGKEKNLAIEKDIVANLKSKFESLVSLIKATLEG